MEQQKKNIPGIHKCIAILWPSFLTAGAATGLFFSAFQPGDLFPFGQHFEISDLGVYTLGFFLIWLFCLVASIGTLYFAVTNCFRDRPRKPGEPESS